MPRHDRMMQFTWSLYVYATISMVKPPKVMGCNLSPTWTNEHHRVSSVDPVLGHQVPQERVEDVAAVEVEGVAGQTVLAVLVQRTAGPTELVQWASRHENLRQGDQSWWFKKKYLLIKFPVFCHLG